MENTFQLEKIWLHFHKSIFLLFWRKTLSGSCKKFRNIILFADYIKFDPQTFDCYIYFVWNIIFQFHSLEFNFYINFGPHFYNCYLLFPYHFFNWLYIFNWLFAFDYIKFGPQTFDCYIYFVLNICFSISSIRI